MNKKSVKNKTKYMETKNNMKQSIQTKQFKYNLHDKVYFINNDEIKEGDIKEIRIDHIGIYYKISINIFEHHSQSDIEYCERREYQLFTNPENVCKYLMGEFQESKSNEFQESNSNDF